MRTFTKVGYVLHKWNKGIGDQQKGNDTNDRYF
jgi:hypothetical protein